MKSISILGLFFIGILWQITVFGIGQIPVFNSVLVLLGSCFLGIVIASIAASLDS